MAIRMHIPDHPPHVQTYLVNLQPCTRSHRYPVTGVIGRTYSTICTRTAPDVTLTSVSAATALDEDVYTGLDLALPPC